MENNQESLEQKVHKVSLKPLGLATFLGSISTFPYRPWALAHRTSVSSADILIVCSRLQVVVGGGSPII